MLKSMEIQLAQSKRREKMAEIQKADEISDDGRTELRSLADAYEGAEVELRAALLVEGTERDKITEPDKAETDFDRECRSFDLTALIGAQVEGKLLSGREAEVSAELETRHGEGQKGLRFPWEALEQRADVVTDATTNVSGNLASRPTMNALERFFENSAASRFGVNVLQVTGAPSFPEITDGNNGIYWAAEGEGADAPAITTTTTVPTIHTATGRYLLTRQAIRQNSALQSILRRDLSEVLREGVDKAVFQGTGVGEQPRGFEASLSSVDALDDIASFSEFLLRATMIQETAKLGDPSLVRIAGAPIVHQTLADTLISGTAVSELDRLKSAGFGMLWSSQVSARGARDATDKGASTVYFGAGSNNAFVPTWGSPELIVDPYSESKTGKVALTIFAFLDVLIQRTATHYFKLRKVQDRV